MPNLRIALDYRSRIQHNIFGTKSICAAPAWSALAQLSFYADSANFARPHSDYFTRQRIGGVCWLVTSQLAALSDIGWTDRSLLQAIN